MSDAKPVDTPAAEPVAAEAPASETVAETAPAEEPKTEDATDAPAAEPAAEGAEPAAEETTALPKEEKTADGEVKITAEPVYSGALGYKAPGLIKGLTFSKKYFWFGEEAAVSKDSLHGYLRGEKGEHAHAAVAWASKTGKGLLFFAKHADQKSAPEGVLKLAEATEVAKEGNKVFSFKLHGHKHSFEATNAAERDGWVVAVETTVEEAKAAAEGVTSSDEYKETIEKLGKPAAPAAAAKAEETAPKKSTEVKPEGEERRGSSSSSSGDDADGKKKKNKKSKSRSQSRKRASRTSIFGGFFEKVRSPTVEKKEAETAPVVPPKDGEAPAATEEAAKPAEGEEAKPAEEAPKTADGEAPAATATTPAKEKGGFFSKFGKAKSPATTPATEAPKEEAKPVEGEAAPAVEGEAAGTPATAAAAAAAPEPGKEKRRTSFFGNFGAKNNTEGEAEGEKKRGLGGLFRNPSKAAKEKKEKKETAAPAKVEEEAENKPEETPATEEAKKEGEEEQKDEENKPAIGDVVPEAVTVGQSSTPAVQATA
ncbi:putative immunogenic protein [Lasiodiplodia theobromae]|nr:putative immunogenic protein [Lasiodiplodia theobromae]